MRAPARCPSCGARDRLTRRFATGGGWRVVGYRCEACGVALDRSGDPT